MAYRMRCTVLCGFSLVLAAQVCLGELISEVNILSFSLSGLAYDGDDTGRYGCCDDDDDATSNCTDPCDPYFQICVGRWNGRTRDSCTGALYVTSRMRNVNTFLGFPPSRTNRPIRTLATSTSLFLPIEIHIRIMDRDDGPFDTDDVIETFHWLSLDDYPDLTNRSWRNQNFTAYNNSISTRIRMYKNCNRTGDVRCSTTCLVPDAYIYNMECVGGTSGLPRCMTGWRGVTCQEDIDECNEVSPCQNNATCANNVPGYTCDCLPGWEGLRCESDTDECSVQSPCQNGGTCYKELPGYRCDCDVGWTGDNCTDDIDECSSMSPCQNGGTCFNEIAGYRCDCGVGWTGDNCTDDIDECSSMSPCQNGGTCCNEIPGYRCDCDAGWTGDSCTDDVDECSSMSPCQNGGTCHNEMPGYRCECGLGWTGDNCTDLSLATTAPTLPAILETPRPSHVTFANASAAGCRDLEAVFLLKGSSSFGGTAFASSKSYIHDLVQSDVFTADALRNLKVGLLVYGDDIEQVKDLGEYHVKDLSVAVTSVRFPSSNGSGRVDLALRRASIMWSIKSSTRLIVVFTDGIEDAIATNNLNIVKDENLENVSVVAVGIRNNNGYLSMSGLQSISVETITLNWVDELRSLFADMFGDCDQNCKYI